MTEAIATLIVMAASLGGLGLFALGNRRRRASVRRVLESAEPAIDVSLDMRKIRAEPDRWRSILQGRVAKVCAISTPEIGDSIRPRYASFLLDVNGESHDLEVGPRFAAIETNARWLADLLGVPYESEI